MGHFLIVYKRSAGRGLEFKEFADSDWDIAYKELGEKEIELKDDNDVEVVILTSSSLSNLQVTHPRYFTNRSFEDVDPEALEKTHQLAANTAERAAAS